MAIEYRALCALTAVNTPAAAEKGSGKVFVLLREPGSFSDRGTYCELSPEGVREHFPQCAPHLDWEAKRFALPVRVESRGKLGWGPSPELDKGNDGAVFLVHGLLQVGWTGNARYEPSLAGGRTLIFSHPEEKDLVAAYCEVAADQDPGEVWYQLNEPDLLGRGEVQAALTAVLEKAFPQGIPILRDASFHPAMLGSTDMVMEGVEEVGRVLAQELVRRHADAVLQAGGSPFDRRGASPVVWTTGRVFQFGLETAPLWIQGRTAGVLSRESAILRRRQEMCPGTPPKGF